MNEEKTHTQDLSSMKNMCLFVEFITVLGFLCDRLIFLFIQHDFALE